MLRRMISWILIALVHIKNTISGKKNPKIYLSPVRGWMSVDGEGLNDANLNETLGSLSDDQIEKVTTICLSEKGLTRIPPNIKRFYNLKTLDFDYNQLKTIESGSFEGLTNLRTLDFSHNQITRIESDSFRGLSNLATIDLNFNQLKAIEDDVFNRLPNLMLLMLADNRLETVSSSAFKESSPKWLHLQNNQLISLPASIWNLKYSLLGLYLQGNPDFSLKSGVSSLGVKNLRRIFGNRVKFDEKQLKRSTLCQSEFLREYMTRKSIHWNLDKLKELRLSEVEDSFLEIDEMLKIVDRILPTNETSANRSAENELLPTESVEDIRNNIRDYIQRLHNKKTTTTRRWPMMDQKDFPLARKLLGNVLKHFADCGCEDVAKANLFVLSNGMKECRHGQIAALNDAHALIVRDYKSQSDDIVSMVEHKIAVLKDLRFKQLVTPPDDRHNVHVLNYWTRKLKDILGFTVNFDQTIYGSLDDDPFGGNSTAVLQDFLDDVFTPEEIISALASEINGEKMEMKNSLLYFISEDKTLTDGEKEILQPNIMDTFSVLYQGPGGVTKDAVQYVLSKMSLLVENGNSVKN